MYLLFEGVDRNMKWCKIGIHKWGKVKQWVIDGKVVNKRKCKHCQKIER
jgi:hypothetical protein